MILAGISIATLTGSGLFEKARLAEQKSKNAQELEDATLNDYENKIGEYIDGNRANSVGEWKLWKSGVGYTSEETAITLPDNYNELLVEVGKDEYYYYTFHIAKQMLLADKYKEYVNGAGYKGDYTIICMLRVKKDKMYLYDYFQFNNSIKAQVNLSVYYR